MAVLRLKNSECFRGGTLLRGNFSLAHFARKYPAIRDEFKLSPFKKINIGFFPLSKCREYEGVRLRECMDDNFLSTFSSIFKESTSPEGLEENLSNYMELTFFIDCDARTSHLHRMFDSLSHSIWLMNVPGLSCEKVRICSYGTRFSLLRAPNGYKESKQAFIRNRSRGIFRFHLSSKRRTKENYSEYFSCLRVLFSHCLSGVSGTVKFKLSYSEN